VPVAGYQPRAIVKASDVPYISQEDKLIVDAITTNRGNVLKPETFIVRTVEPDNTGLVSLVLRGRIMSQFRLETEEDMLGYLDINFGHGVSAVYTNSGLLQQLMSF